MTGKKPRGVLIALFVLIALSMIPLLMALSAENERTTNWAPATSRSTGTQQTVWQIVLPPDGRLSEPINMFTIAPPGGWRVRWDGPLSTLAHWDDGSVGPLSQYWGAKGGEVRFSGPAGEIVTIYVLPPDA